MESWTIGGQTEGLWTERGEERETQHHGEVEAPVYSCMDVGQTRRHDTATQDICSVDAKNSRKRQPVYAEKLHLGMKYTGLLNSRRSNCQVKLVKVKLVKLYAVAHMGSFAELRHSRSAHSATDVQIPSRNSVLHAPLRKNQ